MDPQNAKKTWGIQGAWAHIRKFPLFMFLLVSMLAKVDPATGRPAAMCVCLYVCIFSSRTQIDTRYF